MIAASMPGATVNQSPWEPKEMEDGDHPRRRGSVGAVGGIRNLRPWVWLCAVRRRAEADVEPRWDPRGRRGPGRGGTALCRLGHADPHPFEPAVDIPGHLHVPGGGELQACRGARPG